MTRRTKGEGSIYQRESDGRWFYQVDLGWIDGKRHRPTRSARTLAQLRPKIKALDKELEAGIRSDGSMTVEAWLNHWHKHIAPVTARKQRTLDGYRSYLDTWLIPHLGRHRLDRLNADHIRGLWAAMEGRSYGTKRQAHAILKRALTIAVDEGKILRNPADAKAAAPAPGERGSHGKLTTPQARDVLRVLAHRDDRARWYAALMLGMRQGEALGLRWEDVDLERGYIRVRQSQTRIKGKGLVVGPLKTKKSRRDIPMHAIPGVWQAMRDLPGPRTGLVWGPLDNKKGGRAWRAVLDAAGVPAVPLHAARATTASLLDEYGVSSNVIAEILGHSDNRVTERHYIHGDEQRNAEALGRIAGLIEG